MIKENKIENNKKIKFNKEKGITLITLVITIIVILILAAISISTLFGESGIITKAQKAIELTNLANLEEQAALWNTEKKLGTALSTEDFLNELVTEGLITEEQKEEALENGYIEVEDTKIDLGDEDTTTNPDDDIKIELASDTYFYDSTTVGTEELLRYKKVEGLYYLCNENGIVESTEAANIIEDNLIEYINATISNLSIGTGAYSSNQLILGDGTDNNNMYELGVSEGYSNGYGDGINDGYLNGYDVGYLEGKSTYTGQGTIVYTYHSHTGNSTSGTGCYTTPIYHAHSGSSVTGGGCYSTAVYHTHVSSCYTWAHISGCSGDDPTTGRCPNNCSTTNTWLICGQSNVIVGYSLGCGMSTTTITGYSLGCGKTTSTIETATIVYE